jgi:hypothetical protein
MQERAPRAALPPRGDTEPDDTPGMTHEELVGALRAVDGLVDVSHDPPNFHFRSRPFLHFHQHDDGIYADVRFGSGDFEPVWVTTPGERRALLARVCDHVERLQDSRKSSRWRSDRDR